MMQEDLILIKRFWNKKNIIIYTISK